MTTRELKAMQPARTNKGCATALLPGLAFLTGFFVCMFLNNSVATLATALLLEAAIVVPIIWVCIAAEQRKKVFAAFAANEVFVEQDGDKPLRKIEQFAVEHCGGNLKQALELAVASPVLSREERRAMSRELEDYEREYVLDKCGVSLEDSVAEARREVLTRPRIDADLVKVSRKYRKTQCAYQLMRAECEDRHYSSSLGLEGDSETISLGFGAVGNYHCSKDEYDMAAEGDMYCLVKLEGNKSILLAYSEKDWVIEESLLS